MIIFWLHCTVQFELIEFISRPRPPMFLGIVRRASVCIFRCCVADALQTLPFIDRRASEASWDTSEVAIAAIQHGHILLLVSSFSLLLVHLPSTPILPKRAMLA